jgi:hypothetical protein
MTTRESLKKELPVNRLAELWESAISIELDVFKREKLGNLHPFQARRNFWKKDTHNNNLNQSELE